MSNIIAVAGKGGTGKTTIAALIVRSLKDLGNGSVLAIDADPNSNLGELLGLENVSTIVEIIDDIAKNPDQVPKGISKNRFIDLRVQEALNEEDGFDLLTMGRPEGPGCYCFVNNMLKELITKLMKNYSTIVIDNEAGMEHLSRRLVRTIEDMFIISDSSVIGVRSAGRISKIADELGIKTGSKFLIINKSKNNNEMLEPEMKKTKLALTKTLPFNEELEKAAIKNAPVFNLPENNDVFRIIKDIVKLKKMK